jgi:hypothetical protein
MLRAKVVTPLAAVLPYCKKYVVRLVATSLSKQQAPSRGLLIWLGYHLIDEQLTSRDAQ